MIDLILLQHLKNDLGLGLTSVRTIDSSEGKQSSLASTLLVNLIAIDANEGALVASSPNVEGYVYFANILRQFYLYELLLTLELVYHLTTER